MEYIISDNSNNTTDRARHIYTQNVYLQYWYYLVRVVPEHSTTEINLSYISAKAPGWFLHIKHNVRLMGEYGNYFMHWE